MYGWQRFVQPMWIVGVATSNRRRIMAQECAHTVIQAWGRTIHTHSHPHWTKGGGSKSTALKKRHSRQRAGVRSVCCSEEGGVKGWKTPTSVPPLQRTVVSLIFSLFMWHSRTPSIIRIESLIKHSTPACTYMVGMCQHVRTCSHMHMGRSRAMHTGARNTPLIYTLAYTGVETRFTAEWGPGEGGDLRRWLHHIKVELAAQVESAGAQ